MYKLLALDIDDTITLEPRVAPKEIIAAVDRARDAGIRVTVATGRGYFASSCIVEQLSITEPVINYGGAMINDPLTGKNLHTAEIPSDLVQEVLADAARLDIHAHIYQGDNIIYEKPSEYADAYSRVLSLPKHIDADLRKKLWRDVPKVLLMTTEENAAGLIPMFGEKYRGRLKVSGSSRGFIEFNLPSAHKGAGLEWVAQRLGIEMADTVAVGDNSLDTEMLACAGLGCAMGNASDAIKAVADMVLPSCAEHGVAWLIDEVLLKK